MPGGRPTKYEEKYCDQLIEHMEEGLSFESFAAVIDVHRDTLYEWTQKHPEFSDAKKRAFDKNLLFWERVGKSGLFMNQGQIFNSTVWIFNMKNRHGWRDKVEHTGGDEDDAPISIAYKPKSER